MATLTVWKFDRPEGADEAVTTLRDLAKQVNLVPEKGPVENRDDRLGCVEGERTQPRALASGEKNGPHDKRRS